MSAGGAFQQAARAALRYLQAHVPMGFWAVTRVENGRQTYLVLDENAYGLGEGGSHAWEGSFCIHMASGAAPTVAPDAQAEPLYAAAAVNRDVTIGAYAGAPVREPDGTLFGALCGLDPSPQDAAALATAAPLLALVGEMLTVVLASERAREQATAHALAAELTAERDALTELHNRRAWERHLAEEESRFRALGDPTVIVVLDLDHMKAVNDQAGHAAGDAYLRRAAQILAGAVRSTDVAARLGGDEFALLLRGCDAAVAAHRVKAVETALDEAGVQASVGWAPLAVGRGMGAAVAAADEAMYAAKRERRISRRTRSRPDLLPVPHLTPERRASTG